MFKSKSIKIAVAAAVIVSFIAVPLSLNVYASSLKRLVPSIHPDKAFSASAKALFYPDVNYLVWLKEQKSYNIVGEERFSGQNATLITGKLGEPLAEKPFFQVTNGADNEFDRQIRPISDYTAPLDGKMQVDVTSGHFINYVDTSWIDDPLDGVISVHIHLQGGKFTDSSYNVYHTPTKHGELRILSVRDKSIISLVAADGTKFTFDVKSRTLKQVH